MQVICDDGCETPAINYSQFNGKPYQGITIFQEICSVFFNLQQFTTINKALYSEPFR